jgi:tRNA pseudouridine38-40 synthase
MNEMRILSAAVAPTSMPNSQYALENFPDTEPEFVDWNARFSATQRIYIYRVLAYPSLSDSDVDNDDDDKFEIQDEFGMPFEWDRSWRVRGNDVNTMDYSNTGPLDVDAMRTAASLLEGTHDFSAFRAAKCQRHSPVVTLNEIQINSQPYGCVSNWLGPTLPNSGLLGLGSDPLEGYNKYQPTLLTIVIAGNSFLYRQVRNMVGCLVEAGRRRMEPTDVGNLLEAKQRSGAPSTAPSHGLYLVDVQHGKFKF